MEGAARQRGALFGAEPQPGGQGAGGVVGFQIGPEPQVLDVKGRLGVEVDRAEDAEEPEKVLIFQPVAAAALVDLDAQTVFALPEAGRQVKIRGSKAVLAVAHKLPVAPAVEGPLDALERDADPLAPESLVQDKGFDIAAHGGVVPGNLGRADGVTAIPGIHGVDVLNLTVALQFDVAGDGDFTEALQRGVRLPEISRPLGGTAAVGKLPGTVQALTEIRAAGVPGVIGMGVQPVDRKDAGIFQPVQLGMGSIHEVTSLQKWANGTKAFYL